MTVYQELQLSCAGSKNLIRRTENKEEKKRHILIYNVKVYLVVALLSIFVVPDKQAAMIFVFLGYYPVLKDYLDHHMKSRAVQWIIKFAVFNLSILAAYGLMIYVFQMPDVMTEMGTLGQFTGLVTLLAGNIVFIVFELALTRIFYFYRHFFRPHFLRKVK